MTVTTSYLIQDEGARRVRDAVDWVPEFSRRARGFAVYAALRSLGRSGLVELVERCCDAAARFAERIVELEGAEVVNDVVLNQVLFGFDSDERTDEVIARVQDDGRIWVERHDVGRPQGGPRLGLELADRRRGDRPSCTGVPRRPGANGVKQHEQGPRAVKRHRKRRLTASRLRGRAGPRASGRRSPRATARSRSARRGRRPVETPSRSSR